MKHTARIITIAALASAILLGTALPVAAQTTQKQAEPIKFEDICQRIKNRLNVRVGNVTNASDENITIFEGLNKRLEKVISAAEKNKYDTTELTAALNNTRAAIATYGTANKSYTTELTSTASTVCQSETTYKVAIVSTRASLKAARDAGLEVRNTFQYGVIPELRAYKVWLNTQSSDESVDGDDTELTTPTGEGAE